jgi:hypothetical protein
VSGTDPEFPWNEAEKDLMEEIDTSVPHSARIWNYWLGGKNNYAVDRVAGDRYRGIYPGIVDIARAARAFHTRAVRYLVGEEGIRQFLDVGTGLPTVDNTHEVAHRVAPECRVVYVDNDPLVLVHARALLTSEPPGVTEYIEEDVRDPEAILAQAAKTLELTRPVALMLMGIMGHIVDDAEARSILRRLVTGLAPGSFLVLRDATDTSEAFAEAQRFYNRTGAAPYRLRSPERITRFFDGLELVEPGVVSPLQWRPEATVFGPPRHVEMACGVGRLRDRIG